VTANRTPADVLREARKQDSLTKRTRVLAVVDDMKAKGRPHDPVVSGGSDLCFVWPGTVEEVLAHLRRCQVEIEEGPVVRSGGRGRGVSVYFRDLDDSLLEPIIYR
jgi:hypothetical protein